ncbi:MAG: VWA domain-containing protein [Candidatus Woesearchaeota archaeon]
MANRNVPSEPDSEDKNVETSLNDKKKLEQAEGFLGKRYDEDYDKLMNSVLNNEKEVLEEGGIIKDVLNQNLSSFSPNVLFEHLVKDYKNAKNIYGESLLRQITGESSEALEKNMKFPEYQRQINMKIKKKVMDLKRKGFITKDMDITEKGYELASLALYVQELDHIMSKGFMGEHIHKEKSFYGGNEDEKIFRKGDRYRDIAIKRSIDIAIRRGHTQIGNEDLRAFEKQSKGEQYIVYAIDASGSMKGNKVDVCKKAGVALSYHAIENKDKVGLIVFGEDVKDAIMPTNNFPLLLRTITRIKAAKETNISDALKKCIEMFPNEENITKHVLMLTDALPTSGEDPFKETLEQVSLSRSHGITISVVGINLDKDGEEFAKKIVEIGQGKFYVVNDVDELDRIVLTDYYGFSEK